MVGGIVNMKGIADSDVDAKNRENAGSVGCASVMLKKRRFAPSSGAFHYCCMQLMSEAV